MTILVPPPVLVGLLLSGMVMAAGQDRPNDQTASSWVKYEQNPVLSIGLSDPLPSAVRSANASAFALWNEPGACPKRLIPRSRTGADEHEQDRNAGGDLGTRGALPAGDGTT